MSNKRPSRFQRKNGKVNNEHLAAESQPAIGKKADTVEALAAVPILKYNAGASSNFVDWKKKIGNKAIQDFENLGRCVTDPDQDYWEPDAFDQIDEVLINQDATGNPMLAFRQKRETQRVLKAQDRRDAALETFDKKKPSLYAYIKSTLSMTSESKLKEDDDWNDIQDAMDPLLLMRLIVDTHAAPNTGLDIQDRLAARKIYDKLRQHRTETVDEFREQTQRALDVLEQLDEVIPLADVVAADWIDRLDHTRFSTLKNALNNRFITYPATLQDAYRLASSWKVESKTGGPPIAAGSMFVIRGGHSGRGRGNGRGGGRGGRDGGRGGRGGGSSAPSNSSTTTTTTATAASEVEKVEAVNGWLKCFLCDGNHLVKDCKHMDAARACVHAKIRYTVAEIKQSGLVAASMAAPFERGVQRMATALAVAAAEDDFEFSINATTHRATPRPSQDLKFLGGNEGPLYIDEDFDFEYGHPRAKGSQILITKSNVVVDSTILLDCCATTSIFREERLLGDIRDADVHLKVSGIFGPAVTCNRTGDHFDFGTIYFHPDAAANILCEKDARAAGTLTHHDDSKFHYPYYKLVTHSGRVYEFVYAEDGIYYGKSEQYSVMDGIAYGIQTVKDNAGHYNKRQIKAAYDARDLKVRLGNVSDVTLIKMLSRGIDGCPITPQDVARATKIFGRSIGEIKGKTKRQTPGEIKIEHIMVYPAHQEQVLYVDIMFIDGDMYLISVSDPLDLIQCGRIVNKGADLRSKLEQQINSYHARGFKIVEVRCDGEGAVSAYRNALGKAGVKLDTASKSSHVPVVERNIQTIKERVRGFLRTLPYTLPFNLLQYLVKFCVISINREPSTKRYDGYSPRELFTQMKLNYNRDIRFFFGGYYQVVLMADPTNSMQSRTTGCIALCAAETRSGSVQFYSLATNSVITRVQFEEVPITQDLIDHMNRLAAGQRYMLSRDPIFSMGQRAEAHPEVVPEDVPIIPEEVPDDILGPVIDLADIEFVDPGDEAAEVMEMEETINPLLIDPHPPQLETEVDFEPVINDMVAAEAMEQARDALDPEEEAPHLDIVIPQVVANPERRVLREHRSTYRDGPVRLRAKGFHISCKKAIATYGVAATHAIETEMKQMLDKDVFEPVSRRVMSPEEIRKIIPSSIFVKEKFLPAGDFDKLKARFVAGGNWQDRDDYLDVSSPAAALASLMIVAAIAARERRKVRSMDVDGAYLCALMKSDVWLEIESFIVEYLLNVASEEMRARILDCITANGKLTVKLKRALYGCIESGKLWYETIKAFLESIGLTPNPRDPCVFNDGPATDELGNLREQLTVVVYVDDLLATSTNEAKLDRFTNLMTSEFKKLKVTTGDIHNYLGMTFDFSEPGVCTINMNKYIADILSDTNTVGIKRTPSTSELFVLDEASPLLRGGQTKEFHSMVARLLFASKRARIDVQCVVAFLATRVRAPTEQDWKKLQHLLQYLNGTATLGLKLRIGDRGMVHESYVDASFAVHNDRKSHTGLVDRIGDAVVDTKSSKQKINTNSSCEAEIVAVSESLDRMVQSHDFLSHQGYHNLQANILYQDNESTMSLINHGRARSESTRHIDIKYFYVKDYVERGRLVVQQKPTELMIADFFTKPLHGERFVWLRNIIMGADEVPEQHEAVEVAEPREMRGADWGREYKGP